MKIKSLKLSYFRGFTKEYLLDLSSPVTILYGGNAVGKSSVLNAIEWCLFGDSCKGRDTGLRERVDWEPQNRSDPGRCKVQLVCQFEDGEVVFERVPTKRRGHSGLVIEFSDKVPLQDDDAESWVQENIGSFANFMATVYQHQENIRHLAVAQPKDQREAISRLLGLGDYNDLAELVRKSELMKAMDLIGEELDRWDQLAHEKTSALTEHNRQIGHKISVDPDTVFPETVKEAAVHLLEATKEFTSKREGKWELPAVPTLPDAFDDFVSTVMKCARDCFAALPATEKSQELNEQVTKIAGAIGRLGQAAEEVSTANRKLLDFEEEHGTGKDIGTVMAKITEKKKGLEEKLKALNELTAALNSLLTFMTEHGLGIDEEDCPACGSRTRGQQTYLRRRIDDLLSAEGRSIQNELDEAIRQENEANETLREFERQEKRLEAARETMSTIENEVAQDLLITWKENEDPLQVLEKRQSEVKGEVAKLEEELKKANDSLRSIESECDRLKALSIIWANHELAKRLRSIKDTPAYKELKTLAEEAAYLKLDCQAIVDAVLSVRDEESHDIVEASKAKVRDYFAILTENPAIDCLEMTMETKWGSENYSFCDSAGEDVIPILSLGDLNSLALAIFAGLGEANQDDLAFQTIVFDDPSQSMGSHHKKKLAELLNTLATNRQVIVSTMDKEFFEALNSSITARKKCLTFEGWDPEHGPRISD